MDDIAHIVTGKGSWALCLGITYLLGDGDLIGVSSLLGFLDLCS